MTWNIFGCRRIAAGKGRCKRRTLMRRLPAWLFFHLFVLSGHSRLDGQSLPPQTYNLTTATMPPSSKSGKKRAAEAGGKKPSKKSKVEEPEPEEESDDDAEEAAPVSKKHVRFYRSKGSVFPLLFCFFFLEVPHGDFFELHHPAFPHQWTWTRGIGRVRSVVVEPYHHVGHCGRCHGVAR